VATALTQKIALVTGAAGPGLGFACARLLAEAGAHVVLTDRSERRVDDACARLRSEWALSVTGLVVDVSDEDSIGRGVGRVEAELGGVDVLVNNAALAEPGNIADLTLESWNKVLGVSLTGPFLMMRACIPSMVRRGGGSIVNVSSVEAWAVMDRGLASYAAAKAGLQALTRAAATEYGEFGVRVNAVAPGFMPNRAVEELYEPSHLESIVARTPLGRPGDPEEVAKVVTFLAGDDASFVTGDVVTASGGLYYHA
jgi:3-oxoacyl-[acyl-carrier protein] reductase